MIVNEFVSPFTGYKQIVHDDVLTRDMVETYRGCACMITTERGIQFDGSLRGENASNRYPLVATERIVPLMKLQIGRAHV